MSKSKQWRPGETVPESATYVAYDAQGKIVRNTYISVPLKGVKSGDVVEHRRFDFPRETVKIVFSNYVEAE